MYMQPTVKIQTIAALSPVLGRILVAWDTTNNELSKKRPLFPGETVQQDEVEILCAQLKLQWVHLLSAI